MIIKLSASGKAITVIDDFGNSYGTSVTYLLGLVSGQMKSPFIQLSRYPQPAKLDRYKMSPILGKEYEKIQPDDERWTQPQCLHSVDATSWAEDGMDRAQAKKRQTQETFEEITDW